MSVINQVLKDLDRQGANSVAPTGVWAVNQANPVKWRVPAGLVAGLALILAAWWWWPAATVSVSPTPPVPALLQLRLTQQLGEAGLNSVEPAAVEPESTASTVSPATAVALPPTVFAQAADKASGAAAAPAAKPPNIAFVPQPPRLDTRLPELRQRAAPQPVASIAAEPRQSVVKEVKPLTPQVEAEDIWRQAVRLLEQGRSHDVQARLENVLRLDPTHVGARQSLVALLLDTGATAESGARAEALLRDGLTLHASDPWYPRSLAQLQLQRGDAVQAAATLKASLEGHPDAASLSLYASTLARLGKPAEAASAYREALRLNPAQGNWWIGFAVALEQSGQKTDAGGAFQRALQTRLNKEMRDFAQQKVRELGAR